MTNKEKYIEFLKKDTVYAATPLFLLPQFLDIVAEEWEVALVEKDNVLLAVLPFAIKGNLLTKRIYLPALSFYQSVLLYDNDLTLVEQLMQQLPKTVKSYFKFLPEYIDVDLTHYAYKKELYEIYISTNVIDIKSIRKNHQRNISKAIHKGLIVEAAQNTTNAFEIIKQTFTRQKTTIDLDTSTFNTLIDWARNTNHGELWNCKDQNHNIHASMLILEDATTCYYLLGGYNDLYKSSGAKTFLLWHCMQYSLAKGKSFNFCGSSKKSIANYFEGFSAQTIPIAIWKKQLL